MQIVLSRELLSPDLEKLEADFYKKTLKAVQEYRSSGDQVTAEMLVYSLKLLLLVRVQKELRVLVERGEIPPGIPEEEMGILECVRRVLLSFEGKSEPPVEDHPAQLGVADTPKLDVSAERAGAGHPSEVGEAVLVSFLKTYPRIIDRDISLGPFRRGDLARIPRRIAEELAREGYIEILST